MYRAIILGHGRRYEAKTLELLLKKLELDRIRLNSMQINRLRQKLEEKRRLDVPAKRLLTQSEIIKMYVRKPYLGTPRLEKTEDVKVRFEKIG